MQHLSNNGGSQKTAQRRKAFTRIGWKSKRLGAARNSARRDAAPAAVLEKQIA